MMVLLIVSINFLCKFSFEMKKKNSFVFYRYKGKGASRSDEIGDEKRVYAKFKVSSVLFDDIYSVFP
jgi:hypothetical protein